jgi:ankyrin repeat protein
MKRLTCLALFLLTLTACGRSPQQARKELAELNISYDEWSCFESTAKRDKLAIELFLDADIKPECLLAGASATGDIDLVKKALGKKADPNLEWINLQTAYVNTMTSMASGKNSGINVEEVFSIYPLLLAAGNGHIEIVKLLLDNKTNPNDKEGNSPPLLKSIENSRTEIAKLLIDRGANPNSYYSSFLGSGDRDRSAISEAVKRGNIEIVKSLLDKGVDPQIGLTEAAKGNNREITNLLLDKKGADRN